MRIGHGYDAHRFAKNRTLILGGVLIPHHLGLDGHSDADVLLHAVCDALLGAMAMGDIGKLFPDTDSAYAGIDSRKLLTHVIEKAKDRQLIVGNLDVTVVAQQPRLSPYIDQMRQNIANDCGVSTDQINVKATTTEKMGFTGREEGIESHAVVLLVAN